MDELRIKYISKKGKVNQLFSEFKNVPADQKKEVGNAINVLKNFALDQINKLREEFESSTTSDEGLDLTRPGESMKLGTRHPLSIVKNEIIDIFGRLGFTVSEGPGN